MKRTAMLVVGLALLWPAAAGAQGASTCQAYNPQSCGVSGITSTRSGGPTPQSGDVGGDGPGALPFTGFEIALLVAGGCGLLGAGLVVRRASRLS